MNARRREPTARAARHAVDTLAQLGPDMLALVAQLAIDRLDAAEDTDADFDDNAEQEAEGCCEAADDNPAESWPQLGWDSPSRFAPTDDSDAEPSLGWIGSSGGMFMDQTANAIPNVAGDDAEQQCDDEGVRDSHVDADYPAHQLAPDPLPVFCGVLL